MSCEICGKMSCASSFHSQEAQEQYYKYKDMSEEELIQECIEKDRVIENQDLDIHTLESNLMELKKENDLA